jgi:hypothetical protein
VTADSEREMLCFGGPLDGQTVRLPAPPDGYRDFAGFLVVWHAVDTDAIPLWRGRAFGAAVEKWRNGEVR